MNTQQIEQILRKIHESIVFSFPTNINAQIVAWELFKNETYIKKIKHKNSTVQPEIKGKRVSIEDPFNKDILISVPRTLAYTLQTKKSLKEYERLL